MSRHSLRSFHWALCLLPALLAGCINIPLNLFGNDRGKVSIEEIVPAKSVFTANEILMIPLDGMVREGSAAAASGGEPGMLVGLKDRLEAAKKNYLLKAVILRVDSPGGTITASDLIYREIMKFKAEKKVPVIVMMTDTAASGAVYLSMAGDEIYALPSTVTGSIGVIMMLPGLKGLSDKIGFEMRVIKSGPNKDIGSPWSGMSPAQRAIFQSMIDGFYGRFYSLVLSSRAPHGMTDAMLRPMADGRVLDAQTALKIRLIDGIKYPDEVIARARELAGIKDARVISYEYPANYRGNIYAQSPASRAEARGGSAPVTGSGNTNINLFNVDLGGAPDALAGGRFYYIWEP